ncbi:uncharacterized protein LOC111711500 [Eurytemora carolleeae]|uniref:uncharacterized protein LOC111711500 n=1 Tax=Eurytemora carolleeae TaxID=1294199 RepID=UPI000C771239|nr:uncharacterized protein LOC111711500 [Eurytemora carolleeae]|eukprot:XP_023341642.1 uncharacterized protein LOC111711500 [Eurytemora affinis]
MIIISELGFVPVIDGVKHAPQDSELSNLVEQPTPVRAPVARPRTDLPASRFNNFRPNEIRTDDTDVKVINGRRAVLRKRIRTDAINSSQVQEQQFQEEQQNEDNQELSREEQLRARQEGLKVWEQQRAALVQLQQLQQRQQPASRASVRSESSRGFNAFQPAAAAAAQETFRSFPDPYVTGVNLDSGSYTINY